MDWDECIRKGIVKNTAEDRNMIVAIRRVAGLKIKASDSLADEFNVVKITLLYDALREYLECFALEKGFKVYNHECYTTFLKEIMHLPRESEIFDELRKRRNGINYYGEIINKEKANELIMALKGMIDKFKLTL